MESNQKLKKFEIDIEIKDMLWEFLRRWRMIIVLALICGIALTAYQYRIDMNKTDVVVVKKTQEELERAMAAQDLNEVTAAVALKRQMDEKSAYMEESVLMQINPYEENAVILQYYISADTTDVVKAANASYIAFVKNEMSELVSVVTNDSTIYINAENVTESIQLMVNSTNAEQVLCVKAIGKSMEEAKALAEEVDSLLKEYVSKIRSTVGMHNLLLLNSTERIIVDQALAELQNWNATSIKTISNNLDKMKNEMTGDQITLYTYRVTNVVTENNSGTSQTIVEDKNVNISIKHLAIGLVVGIVLACGVIFVLYIMSPTLRSKEELTTLYGVKILGSINVSSFGKKKVFGCVDKAIGKLRNIRKKYLTCQQEIQIIGSNILLNCMRNEISEVFVTSTVAEKIPQEVKQAIVNICEGKGITPIFGGTINYDAQALEMSAKVGNVIFIEKERTSLYDELHDEVMLCKEQGIAVLGMIVLNE